MTAPAALIEPIPNGLREEFKLVHTLIGTLLEGKSVTASDKVPREVLKWVRRRFKPKRKHQTRFNPNHTGDAAKDWHPKNPAEMRIAFKSIQQGLDDLIHWAPFLVDDSQIAGKLMVSSVARSLGDECDDVERGERVRVALVVSELFTRIVQTARELKCEQPDKYPDPCTIQTVPSNHLTGWLSKQTRGSGITFTSSSKALLDAAIARLPIRYPHVFPEEEEKQHTGTPPTNPPPSLARGPVGYDDDDDDD
jgi:hypothetical protein